MNKSIVKALVSRQRTKFEQHIAKLSEALSLSEPQKAALSKWLDERLEQMSAMDLSDPGALTDPNRFAALLSTKGLEEELSKNLSEDQKAALAGFKEREKHAKVDALALASLSKMQGVFDFEEGQRDAVYKILSQEAEQKVERQNDSPSQVGLMTEGMGIDMDPYDLGIMEAMESAFKPGDMPDQKTVASTMRKIIDERIAAKVDLLRPVLNEKQLEQYRVELKSKGLGFMGPALMEQDQDVSSPSVIMIPGVK